MTYKLGTKSLERLSGAKPVLQDIVKRAIEISAVDFSVIETLRTLAQQEENVKNGVSWTMASLHLPDEDGESRAVDIYPWVDGQTKHDDIYYRKIAKAMFRASQECGVRLEWGGFWENQDKPHFQIITSID